MLVLTRYPGESIWVGDDIKITMLRARKGRVSIGITAPRELEIRREEIDDDDKNKEEENKGDDNPIAWVPV